MAPADCELCRLMGYRSCDVCGGVVFRPGVLVDVCDGCRLVVPPADPGVSDEPTG